MSSSDPEPGDGVVVERVGAAAVVRLDRPAKLNAFDRPMLGLIREAVAEACLDPGVAGIVVTGTGKGFCSGFDQDGLRRLADEGAGGLVGSGRRPGTPSPLLFGYLTQATKPVVAAVNGVAAGGGLVLALSCDLRFTAPGAQYLTSFSSRGLVACSATSWLLPRIVGTSRALDLLFSSRRVGADEALRVGLSDRTSPDALGEACDYVNGLARTASPSSLRDIKRQVYEDWSASFQEAADAAYDLNAAAFDRVDAAEGAQSLLERRLPRFPPLPAPGHESAGADA